MFIAKNEDLIILANDSKETLEQQLQFMVYTSIEETEEEYILYNGSYITTAEALVAKKEDKYNENTTKAKEAITNGYVVYKEAKFETDTTTCSDLTSTSIIMQTSGIETWEWVTKDDKVLTLELTDFASIGALIAQYKNAVWNVKYVAYKSQIAACTTIEEVEAIEIDYDVPTMLEGIDTKNVKQEELNTDIVEENEAEETVDYSQYTVAQLKVMADEKGLTYSSNILKADLIALLEENDK